MKLEKWITVGGFIVVLLGIAFSTGMVRETINEQGDAIRQLIVAKGDLDTRIRRLEVQMAVIKAVEKREHNVQFFDRVQVRAVPADAKLARQ